MIFNTYEPADTLYIDIQCIKYLDLVPSRDGIVDTLNINVVSNERSIDIQLKSYVTFTYTNSLDISTSYKLVLNAIT